MKFLHRKIIPYFLGFTSAFILLFLYTYFYTISKDYDAKTYESILISIGKKSIPSKDVPVASLVIYNGKIIGIGNNDVVLNNNPSGHAEINALTNCFKKIGYQKFMSLDREKLILLTTYEPCTMCKGAIEEYCIKHVVFNLAKSKKDKLDCFKNNLKYYYHLQQTKNKRLQYDLFKMYPGFDTIKHPY